MTSLVSCLVPAFNAAQYLPEALESILAQSYREIEVIVIDDGSADNTAEVARQYAPEVRVIQREHCGGLAARDAAVEAANGEFVAFLDADDRWADTKIEKQVTVLSEHPEVDLCVTQFMNFWEDPEAAEAYAEHPLAQPQAGYIVPTLLARRSVFEKMGGFLSASSDTGWFAGAVSRGYSVYTVSEVLMHRRIHSTNLSVVDSSSSLDGIFDLIRVRRNHQFTPPAE